MYNHIIMLYNSLFVHIHSWKKRWWNFPLNLSQSVSGLDAFGDDFFPPPLIGQLLVVDAMRTLTLDVILVGVSQGIADWSLAERWKNPACLGMFRVCRGLYYPVRRDHYKNPYWTASIMEQPLKGSKEPSLKLERTSWTNCQWCFYVLNCLTKLCILTSNWHFFCENPTAATSSNRYHLGFCFSASMTRRKKQQKNPEMDRACPGASDTLK